MIRLQQCSGLKGNLDEGESGIGFVDVAAHPCDLFEKWNEGQWGPAKPRHQKEGTLMRSEREIG